MAMSSLPSRSNGFPLSRRTRGIDSEPVGKRWDQFIPFIGAELCQTPIAGLEIGPLANETMDKRLVNYDVAHGRLTHRPNLEVGITNGYPVVNGPLPVRQARRLASYPRHCGGGWRARSIRAQLDTPAEIQAFTREVMADFAHFYINRGG
jgi:hypothetical protein